MLKRHFGLVDAVVEFKLISHVWPLLSSRMLSVHLLPLGSSSACCLLPKIRSRHGLVSASPFPLKDSP